MYSRKALDICHLHHRNYRDVVVIDRPSTICPLLGAAFKAADTGVLDRVGTALLLCAMCAETRCPAASALHRLSSPARTLAATIRASRRALSPGFVGCAPLTPRRSRQALWGSRTVPPPIVPTSIQGIETEIWRLPLKLSYVSIIFVISSCADSLPHDRDTITALNVLRGILTSG